MPAEGGWVTASVTLSTDPETLAARTYLSRLALGSEARTMSREFVEVSGTVMLADITGFTALSERLSARGKEGAELLTTIINHYFQRLLDSAVAYGGDNLKFGGDALLLFFNGPGHADRAVAAALAMQSENRRASAMLIGGVRTRLQMRISIHTGSFWSAIAGTEGIRLQHVIAGPGIVKLADVDKKAAPGEVAISEATLGALSAGAITALREETIVVQGLDGRGFRERSQRILDAATDDEDAAFQRWGFTSGGEGEHRKVTIIFARLDGLNELLAAGEAERAFRGLNRFVDRFARAVQQFGGYLAGNDVDQSGLKFIVLFGAPVANEQAAANALRFAMAMNESGPDMDQALTLRVGVNSGFTFCGDVGASHRREYTVLGDAVNLSARLMARSDPGQILVSDATAAESGPSFRWFALEPMTIKGKAQPVPVRLLHDERRQNDLAAGQGRFIGRDAELQHLASAIGKAFQGRGQVIAVTGEPGSGKSRLVAEILGPLAQDWTVLRGEALSFTSGMPFGAWTGVLTTLLELGEARDIASRTALAGAAIEKLVPAFAESAALLNPLLSLAFPESDLLRSLDADSRRERLLGLFGQLLVATSERRPTAVVIEDLHWADQSSFAVLATVAKIASKSRLFVCVTSRTGVHLPTADISLSLAELPDDEALALLGSMLGASALGRPALAAIAEKCRGNPLFLEEVARTLMFDARPGSSHNAVVPDRLQSLLMARLDALPFYARRLIRLLSVLGTSFDTEIVWEMVEPELRPEIELALQDLVANGIILADDDSGRHYRFRHSLQQEVAYESLLFARRRELHALATLIIEARSLEDPGSVVETLAYHAAQSGDSLKSARYATLAGDKSRGVYAWESAITYYHTALAELAKRSRGSAGVRSAVLERIADCRELAGHYGQAAETYVQALGSWTAHREHPAAGKQLAVDVSLPIELEEASRDVRLRMKIAVAFERNSQFDRSLRWLRAAQRVMTGRRPDLRADIFSSWSVVAFRKGQFSEAVSLARKALVAARTTADPARIAYSHHVLANCYGETGRLRRSVYHREAALGLYQQLGDVPRLFAGHGNLGLSYHSLGEFERAAFHHLECIKAAELIGNEVAAAIGQNNLGETLLAQGHVREAGERFAATVAVFREGGEPRVPAGLALINLSRVALQLGDSQEAEDYLIEGTALLGAISRGLAVEAILQEAEVAFARGDFAAADAACSRAMFEANELGMLLIQARANLLRARMQIARGDLREATANGRSALAVARRLGAAYETAQALLMLAELAALDGTASRNRRSARLAGSAAELFTGMGSMSELGRALELAGD